VRGTHDAAAGIGHEPFDDVAPRDRQRELRDDGDADACGDEALPGRRGIGLEGDAGSRPARRQAAGSVSTVDPRRTP
jgi:hypothetical protein